MTENCSFHAKLTSSGAKKYADFRDAKFSFESCLSKLLTMWFNSVRDCLVVAGEEENNVYKYSVCVCVCVGGGEGGVRACAEGYELLFLGGGGGGVGGA